MEKLKNKTILITGQLLPTVKACALAAGREGANIVVADKRSYETEKIITEMKKTNRNVVFVECDHTDYGQVQTAVETATSLFSTIDIALNNSWDEEKLSNAHEQGYDDCLQRNYYGGIYNCLGPQLQQMAKQKKGVIIKMSAALDKRGFTIAKHAVTVKHEVRGLTKNSAFDYATEGIRINAICPASPLPETLSRRKPDAAFMKDKTVIDYDPGNPDDLANLFIFLASDQSSFVFGTTLEIGSLNQP